MEEAQEQVRKLPTLIRPLYTIPLLQSEVENGGFNQYFWNSSGRLAAEALDDLVYLRADQHAMLLREAIVIERKESPTMFDFKRSKTWDCFAESYKHSDLGAIDEDFYQLEKLEKFCANHVRNNFQEIQNWFRKKVDAE